MWPCLPPVRDLSQEEPLSRSPCRGRRLEDPPQAAPAPGPGVRPEDDDDDGPALLPTTSVAKGKGLRRRSQRQREPLPSACLLALSPQPVCVRLGRSCHCALPAQMPPLRRETDDRGSPARSPALAQRRGSAPAVPAGSPQGRSHTGRLRALNLLQDPLMLGQALRHLGWEGSERRATRSDRRRQAGRVGLEGEAGLWRRGRPMSEAGGRGSPVGLRKFLQGFGVEAFRRCWRRS